MAERKRENSDIYFEKLFKAEYKGLMRYALSVMRGQGRSVAGDPNGKAEAAVQEMFAVAWKKQDEVFESESPVGWLYKALYYKILEILDDENLWTKRIMKASEFMNMNGTNGKPDGYTLELKTELRDLLPEEDYRLLCQLYLEGYTYQELSCELGISKSAFAMRVKRIKERFIKNYGEI